MIQWCRQKEIPISGFLEYTFPLGFSADTMYSTGVSIYDCMSESFGEFINSPNIINRLINRFKIVFDIMYPNLSTVYYISFISIGSIDKD